MTADAHARARRAAPIARARSTRSQRIGRLRRRARRRAVSARQRVRVGGDDSSADRSVARDGVVDRRDAVLSRAPGRAATRRSHARSTSRCSTRCRRPTVCRAARAAHRRRARADGFLFAPAERFERRTRGAALRRRRTTRLFDVRAAPLVQGEVAQRDHRSDFARAPASAFLLALGCFVIGVWRGTRTLSQRVAALAIGLACTALVPLNQYSNLTRLFDPAVYFTPRGGPLTGNAGALATTSALVLLGVLAVFRRQSQRASRWAAVVDGAARRRPRAVSAARARARRSGSAARRRRDALADLGGSALSRGRVRAARRRGRRRDDPRAASRTAAVGRAARRDVAARARAGRVGGARAAGRGGTRSSGSARSACSRSAGAARRSFSARRPSRHSARRRWCGDARRADASTPRCAISRA